MAGTNDCVFDSNRTSVVRADANPDSAIRSLLPRNPGPLEHSPPTQNVSGMDLNQNMERMFGNLSDYWADSKRSQPATPGGAVIHISSRLHRWGPVVHWDNRGGIALFLLPDSPSGNRCKEVVSIDV